MKKRRLLIAAALVSVLVLTAIRMTASYLTDVETMNNVITIGKVNITLDEGSFNPKTSVPGRVEVKAPKLKNTGGKDEYVFIKLLVPKGEVTLLYEENNASASPPQVKGTPIDGKKAQELFRFLTDPSIGTDVRITPASFSGGTGTYAADIDITYHAGSDNPGLGGWVLLEEDFTGADNDAYIFGYNKKLAPTDETVTLFDKVQLKSFIDGEVVGASEIGVCCYGIQADNLELGGIDLNVDYLDGTRLNGILSIVKNKLAGSA